VEALAVVTDEGFELVVRRHLVALAVLLVQGRQRLPSG
jgi:hypothetical protein